MKILDEAFYLRDAVTVSRELLGTYIMRTFPGGAAITARIVETEAYTQDDPASHSFAGRTPRCSVMFQKGGVAYVYLIYGMYDCFNAVTGPEGRGEAVLIRAAEPVSGAELMWERRFPGRPFDSGKSYLLLRGPGNLCRGLGIDRATFNGRSLSEGALTILTEEADPAPGIAASARIGIRKGAELMNRFFVPGCRCVSGKKTLDNI